MGLACADIDLSFRGMPIWLLHDDSIVALQKE
jgi:hypothetical protein